MVSFLFPTILLSCFSSHLPITNANDNINHNDNHRRKDWYNNINYYDVLVEKINRKLQVVDAVNADGPIDCTDTTIFTERVFVDLKGDLSQIQDSEYVALETTFQETYNNFATQRCSLDQRLKQILDVTLDVPVASAGIQPEQQNTTENATVGGTETKRRMQQQKQQFGSYISSSYHMSYPDSIFPSDGNQHLEFDYPDTIDHDSYGGSSSSSGSRKRRSLRSNTRRFRNSQCINTANDAPANSPTSNNSTNGTLTFQTKALEGRTSFRQSNATGSGNGTGTPLRPGDVAAVEEGRQTSFVAIGMCRNCPRTNRGSYSLFDDGIRRRQLNENRPRYQQQDQVAAVIEQSDACLCASYTQALLDEFLASLAQTGDTTNAEDTASPDSTVTLPPVIGDNKVPEPVSRPTSPPVNPNPGPSPQEDDKGKSDGGNNDKTKETEKRRLQFGNSSMSSISQFQSIFNFGVEQLIADNVVNSVESVEQLKADDEDIEICDADVEDIVRFYSLQFTGDLTSVSDSRMEKALKSAFNALPEGRCPPLIEMVTSLRVVSNDESDNCRSDEELIVTFRIDAVQANPSNDIFDEVNMCLFYEQFNERLGSGDAQLIEVSQLDDSPSCRPTREPTRTPTSTPTQPPTIPPPPNDTCENARTLQFGVPVAGTTLGATWDNVGVCGTNNTSPGVWYTITDTDFANALQASTCGFATFDTKISVFTGTCSNLICVGGNDDFCGLQSEVFWSSLQSNNAQYFVLVHGFGAIGRGDFLLQLDETLVPTEQPTAEIDFTNNDVCVAAQQMSVGEAYTDTTVDATVDNVGFCGTSNTAPGVWFSINAVTTSIMLRASTCGMANSYDTKISVFSGACSSLVCVGGNDDFCNSQSQVVWTAQANTRYFIVVHGWSSDTGDFTLNVTESIEIPGTEPIGNDLCENAVVLSPGEQLLGSTLAATFDNEYFCGTSISAPGVWYSVIGTGTSLQCGTCEYATFDTKISLFTGSCGDLSCLSGSDDACGLRSEVRWDSEVGVQYFVLVHGFSSTRGDFRISVRDPDSTSTVTTTNDACADAIPLTLGIPLSGSTVSTSTDNMQFCGTSNTGPGVWYSVDGTGDWILASTCGYASFDTKLSIFNGTCGSLTCVNGNDDGGTSCVLRSELSWESELGTQYFVLVHGYSSSTGDFTLDVRATDPPGSVVVDPPENDLCENALPLSLGQERQGTTEGATFDDASFCVVDNTAPGAWFSFNSVGGWVRTRTCVSESFVTYDTKISVFNGTCDALECVGGNDDACSIQSEVTWESVPDVRYFILVHGFWRYNGAFKIAIEETDAPDEKASTEVTYDSCEGAVNLTLSSPYSGSTSNSSFESVGYCGTSNTAPGVWFSVVGTGGRLLANTCGFASYDTKISVFRGTCSSLICERGNDDWCEKQSEVVWDSLVGVRYFIRVHGFQQSTGEFEIVVERDRSAPTISSMPSISAAPSVVPSASRSPTTSSIPTASAVPTASPSTSPTSSSKPTISIAPSSSFVPSSTPTVSFAPSTLPSSSPSSRYNDACSDSVVISLNTPYEGSTVNATFDALELCVFSITSPGIWYSVTGTGGSLRASLCDFANFDTKLAVFTGTCSNLECVAGNDDWCGFRSQVTWDSSVGEEYFVLVHGREQQKGDFRLVVNGAINDVCEAAVTVQSGGSVSGSTSYASVDDVATVLDEDSTCDTSFSSPGVWYSVMGTGDPLIAKTCGMASYDTKISIFSGTCNSLICKRVNDDSCGVRSLVQWDSQASEQYFVLVHGFGQSFGDFELVVMAGTAFPSFNPTISFAPSISSLPSLVLSSEPSVLPSLSSIPTLSSLPTISSFPTGSPSTSTSDVCSNSIPLSLNTEYSGSTSGATPDSNAVGCGGITYVDPGVWFSITGTGGGLFATTCGVLNGRPGGCGSCRFNPDDTLVSVFTGTCSNLQCLGANDNSCSPTSEVEWVSESGVIYYVLVQTKFQRGRDFNVWIRGASNDFCNQAESVQPVDYVLGSTLYATESDVASCGGVAVTSPGVWYSIVGTGGELLAHTCNRDTNFDTKISVFSGSCDNPLCVVGNDDGPEDFGDSGCGVKSLVQWGSELGATYFILVHGYGNLANNNGDFAITIGDQVGLNYDSGLFSSSPSLSAAPSVRPSVSMNPTQSSAPSTLPTASSSPTVSSAPSASFVPSTPDDLTSPTLSPVPSVSSVPTSKPSISASPSTSAVPSASIGPSVLASGSLIPTHSVVPSVSGAPSTLPSASSSPTVSSKPSVSFVPSVPSDFTSPTLSSVPSVSFIPTSKPSISASPTISAVPSASIGPSVLPNSSMSPTHSVVPSVSGAPSTFPSASSSPSMSSKPSASLIPSVPGDLASPTLSSVPSVSSVPTSKPSISSSPTSSTLPSASIVPSVSPSGALGPTQSAVPSVSGAPSTFPSASSSPTVSSKPSASFVPSVPVDLASPKPSSVPSISSVPTSRPSISESPTSSAMPSFSNSPSESPLYPAPSISDVPSAFPTNSLSPTLSVVPSVSDTPSILPSTSQNPTISLGPSVSFGLNPQNDDSAFSSLPSISSVPSTKPSTSATPTLTSVPSFSKAPMSLASSSPNPTNSLLPSAIGGSSLLPSVWPSYSSTPMISARPSASFVPGTASGDSTSSPTLSSIPSFSSIPTTKPSTTANPTLSYVRSNSDVPSALPSASVGPTLSSGPTGSSFSTSFDLKLGSHTIGSSEPTTEPSISEGPTLTGVPTVSHTPSVTSGARDLAPSAAPSAGSVPDAFPITSANPTLSSIPSVSHASSVPTSSSQSFTLSPGPSISFVPSALQSLSESHRLSSIPSVSTKPSTRYSPNGSLDDAVSHVPSLAPTEGPSLSSSPSASADDSTSPTMSQFPSGSPDQTKIPSVPTSPAPSLLSASFSPSVSINPSPSDAFMPIATISYEPSEVLVPTGSPNTSPTPVLNPSTLPSLAPSDILSVSPSALPSSLLGSEPTSQPTAGPTAVRICPVDELCSDENSQAIYRICRRGNSLCVEEAVILETDSCGYCDIETPSSTPNTILSSKPSESPNSTPITKSSSVPSTHPSPVGTIALEPTNTVDCVEQCSNDSGIIKYSVCRDGETLCIRPRAILVDDTCGYCPDLTQTEPPTVPTAEAATESAAKPPSHLLTEPLPTESPLERPAKSPAGLSVEVPTVPPSESSTVLPAKSPSVLPAESPLVLPVESPTVLPVESPTVWPAESPSVLPAESPEDPPTESPADRPTTHPTVPPTKPPTGIPTESAEDPESPTNRPPMSVTHPPTKPATYPPTESPLDRPTDRPADRTRNLPTDRPTDLPTDRPTAPPTDNPTAPPTDNLPTDNPTAPLTDNPTAPPTDNPATPPTDNPTAPPTDNPTAPPTDNPTAPPTVNPTAPPTDRPTNPPTERPTDPPTDRPTDPPTKPHANSATDTLIKPIPRS